MAKSLIVIATIVLVAQVLAVRSEEDENVMDSMELDARGAGSNSKASNVNNININVLKLCRQLEKKRRNGKRSEEAERFEKRGNAASNSGASNVNNIDIHAVKPLCRKAGYKV